MGVTTMKMISSTSITSTSGVTLMLALTLPLGNSTADSLLLQEEGHHVRGRVRHLDLEALVDVGEVVVAHHRGDGDEESHGGGHQRLGDTGRHRRDAARAGGRHTLEGPDDPQHGAEESDEGGGGADGGQPGKP